MNDNSGSQSVIPGPRHLLEMQILRPPRSAEWDLLNELRTQLVVFNKLCMWLWARLSLETHWVTRVASQVALVVKNQPANAGDVRDVGSVPGSGRFPGGGQGSPLQYSCLDNPMDRGAWRATVCGVKESQTKWSRLAQHSVTRKCDQYLHFSLPSSPPSHTYTSTHAAVDTCIVFREVENSPCFPFSWRVSFFLCAGRWGRGGI